MRKGKTLGQFQKSKIRVINNRGEKKRELEKNKNLIMAKFLKLMTDTKLRNQEAPTNTKQNEY